MSQKISLCTALRNRRWQFERTFPENLDTLRTYSNVEWVIVDYGSTENEREIYLQADPPEWVKWIEVEAPFWHMARAKNSAIKRSTGQIIMTFDCDQWLRNAVEAASLVDDGILVHNWNRIHRSGTAGRVAFTRVLFDALGGYDESLLPCGCDDWDLLGRAKAMGACVQEIDCGEDAAIKNSKEETISCCRVDGLSWEDMNTANQIRSKWNIGMGILKANVN